MQENAANVVVFHQGALGDFILALPVFDGLHSINPGIRLNFWSKADHVSLISNKPYMGGFCPFDNTDLVPFYHADLWREAVVPPFFRDAEAIFIFGQSNSKLLASRLGEKTNIPVHWIQSFPGDDSTQPVSKFIVEQMRSLGYPLPLTFPNVRYAKADGFAVNEWLGSKGLINGDGPVLAHPGSGARRKIWPLWRWWDLLHSLRTVLKCNVILTLGPADDYLREFADSVTRLGVQIVKGVSLGRLAALLGHSRLYIGSDSGVSHLAAAVGIPTVVIFGPTSPAVWAPRGPVVKTVQSDWEDSEILAWSPTAPVSSPENKVWGAINDLLMSNFF